MVTELSLIGLFQMGGVFMWPLLLFSVATMTIIIERSIYLAYHDLRVTDLQLRVEQSIKEQKVPAAITWLQGLPRRRMGVRVLLALLNHAKFGEHRIEKAVEAEAMVAIRKMESGFNFLVALGSLAPLTGFLGTVSGMIGAFKSIAEATEVNAKIVANGIYEALVTTVFGLIISIVAIAAHHIFSHLVDNFTAAVEKASSDIITEIAINAAVPAATPAANQPL
jgi:biopolymer transport protein ExbB